jgi:hypothetical protein
MMKTLSTDLTGLSGPAIYLVTNFCFLFYTPMLGCNVGVIYGMFNMAFIIFYLACGRRIYC